jgi:hypothetical protein
MDIRLITSMIETLRSEQADIDRIIAGFEELASANGDATSPRKGRKGSRSDARSHPPSSSTQAGSGISPVRKSMRP